MSVVLVVGCEGSGIAYVGNLSLCAERTGVSTDKVGSKASRERI